MPLELERFQNECGPKRLHRGRQGTDRGLRRQGQSSFNVLMRGSPDASGIRGALCGTGFPGMAGSLSPSGPRCRPETHCALTGAPSSAHRLAGLLRAAGQGGAVGNSRWGDCLKLVGFMSGADRGQEGGGLEGVCSQIELERTHTASQS